MLLSKPLISALGFYFDQLFNHPIRTKAITSCVIASAGNYASQCIAGNKSINYQSLFAYGGYGLLFGGAIQHYFYNLLEKLVPEESSFPAFKKLFIERLIYTPLFQAFTLYVIARMEGKDHETAVGQLKDLYLIMLTSSWKYLTVVQLLNLTVVPPVLRVLFVNLVAFVWVIYVSNKRRQQQAKKS